MKPSTRITITGTLCALALTASLASADKKKHEAKFCTSLSALNDDFTRLDAIGPNSTVKELRTALDKTEKDANTIEKEARKIKSDAAKQFSQATNQLAVETRNIPENMTLAQVKSRIRDDVNNVITSAKALAVDSGCPDAIKEEPKAEESPSASPSETPKPEVPKSETQKK